MPRKNTLIQPHLTEKTANLAQAQNVYVFKLSPQLNCSEIKKLLEAEYKVNIIKLRTMIIKGKSAASIHLKTRSRSAGGKRSDFKKAYATLKAGQSIPIFVDTKKDDK
ncbi:MAG: 50S ribosomal protein L23 [Candidatus Saccharibacteria bacterium]|nr:50S ribosomal protein L23 [Candidatus Saccharibacteria bacterium]